MKRYVRVGDEKEVEDAKVAREFRSEGIPPYKAGKEDRRLWNAGMRGLHDVENQALQHWLR